MPQPYFTGCPKKNKTGVLRERERERGLFNSDRMHAQIKSDNTTVHAIKFTVH